MTPQFRELSLIFDDVYVRKTVDYRGIKQTDYSLIEGDVLTIIPPGHEKARKAFKKLHNYEVERGLK